MRPACDVNEPRSVVLAWDVTHRIVITTAYLIFWGPLFAVTLVNWDWDYEDAKASTAHEVFWRIFIFLAQIAMREHSNSNHTVFNLVLLTQVTLHVAFVHAFVNPALLMVLHRGIRQVISIKLPEIISYSAKLSNGHP